MSGSEISAKEHNKQVFQSMLEKINRLEEQRRKQDLRTTDTTQNTKSDFITCEINDIKIDES